MTKRPLTQLLLRTCAIVGALTAFAVSATGATARSSAHAVKVIDGNGDAVAIFHSAKCKIGRLGFFSDARSGGWHLEADVVPFKGFHHYRLARGHFTPQNVALVSPSGVRYSSDYVPPYPVPGGGAINFTDHGGLVGVGFSPMFSTDGSDAVTVAGVLACHYPRRNRH
jgi:hypothetical protein